MVEASVPASRPDRSLACAVRTLARSVSVDDGVQYAVDHAADVTRSWVAVAAGERLGRRLSPVHAASDAMLTDTIAPIAAAASASPGRDAFALATAAAAPDLRHTCRWPDYAEAVTAATPIRAVLAMPLQLSGRAHGVITFYFAAANRLDDVLGRAAVCADVASFAVERACQQRQVTNLEIALGTSRCIGTALGILVERHRITPEAAFMMLRQSSQHTHTKLADVADELVRTGDLLGYGAITGSG
jgi:GAF domain-containing protein